MRKGILIGISLMLCLAAVPYGSDLANVYVRPLDLRDEIYKGIGIPREDFTSKFGGLSERTLIMGNLQAIPSLMNEIDALKKQVAAFEKELKKPADPNEVKK